VRRSPALLPALVALALAVGLLAGLTVHLLGPEAPASSGVAEPLVASGDPMPPATSSSPLDDPATPPLATGITLGPQVLGAGATADEVSVPTGWRRKESFANEAQWAVPGNPQFTYFLRIEQIGTQHRTAAEMVDDKLAELADLEALDVVEEGPGELHVTYVLQGHRRHVMLRWVDLRADPDDLAEASEVELEVALAGRAVDVPAMTELVDRVAAGARD
jgi:hypothetical protein